MHEVRRVAPRCLALTCAEYPGAWLGSYEGPLAELRGDDDDGSGAQREASRRACGLASASYTQDRQEGRGIVALAQLQSGRGAACR